MSKYERPEHILKDDGIVDEEAVRLSVLGVRKVRLTEAEQWEVARRLVRTDPLLTLSDFCARVRVSSQRARAMLDELGYEVGGKDTSACVFTVMPKDRPRGEKISMAARPFVE